MCGMRRSQNVNIALREVSRPSFRSAAHPTIRPPHQRADAGGRGVDRGADLARENVVGSPRSGPEQAERHVLTQAPRSDGGGWIVGGDGAHERLRHTVSDLRAPLCGGKATARARPVRTRSALRAPRRSRRPAPRRPSNVPSLKIGCVRRRRAGTWTGWSSPMASASPSPVTTHIDRSRRATRRPGGPHRLAAVGRVDLSSFHASRPCSVARVSRQPAPLCRVVTGVVAHAGGVSPPTVRSVPSAQAGCAVADVAMRTANRCTRHLIHA